VVTQEGRGAAGRAQLDETRWATARRLRADDPVLERYDGLTPIDDVLTADQVAHLDRMLPKPEST
jgi:manganese/zinc/iron transport system permease protein